MIGRTLAHYEISGLLGKGGMGEVYRAHDTKLDRDVALKVLPSEVARDPERIARFEREARTLATLQHPNVASVYGFEETSEARFLVMELVEGEDLAQRIARGPVPVEETVSIVRQLTEGLEAAHERGIVHRDLKPANVKIDPEGVVKILDFGLARAYVGDPETPEDLDHSPTITAAMTQAGTILGTAAYMSPEQAKGRTVDKRADIWALGAIVFEMLSGRRLFDAETISETIAGVLLTEIDWSLLPATTPPSLRALLERCLQKDPKLRLRDVGEARILLADPERSVLLHAREGTAATASGSSLRHWPWAAAVLVALALGLIAGRMFAPQPTGTPDPPSLLFDIPDPSMTMVTGSLALSPDGEHLVFARRDSVGGQSLWIRRLDEDGVRPLHGTRGARMPFWSPDGRSIGFFVGEDLYRASLDGSASSQLASIRQGPMGGAWNQDDVILVGTNAGPIFRVAASGGLVESVTEVEAGVEETHCWPMFLPDGQHFVFLSDASSDEGHRLHVHSLDGSTRKILKKAIRSAIFVDSAGALLFCHNGQLFAQPFDFSRREFTGPQRLVQDGLQPFGQRHECALTLSGNGVLAYQKGSDEAVVVRVRLDGSDQEELLSPDRYRNPRLSPDGRKLAFEVQGSADERLIWVHDLARGTRTLISERGAMSDSPVWSADGESVYFGSSISGRWQTYAKRVYGGSPPELLGVPEGTDDIAVLDCSHDGKWLLVGANYFQGSQDLYLGSLDTEPVTWRPWLKSAAHEQFARFSPDTRWIAFESDTTGQPEIYVAPLEGGPTAQQWMISVNGGADAAWSRDGERVFYRSPTGYLMEVGVSESESGVEFGAPVSRIELQPPRVGYLRNVYDPDRDTDAVIAFLETGRYTPAIRLRTGWREW